MVAKYVSAKKGVAVLLAVGVVVLGASSATAERQKHSLERFGIEDLNVYSISCVRESGCCYAYILDPDGFLHHLEVGEYIGEWNGRVEEITNKVVKVIELRPSKDGWQEVTVILRVSHLR